MQSGLSAAELWHLLPTFHPAIFLNHLQVRCCAEFLHCLSAHLFYQNIQLFHQSMIWVYLSVVISTLIGYFFYKTNNNLIYYGSMCIISSLTFFLITNFTVWLFTTMYSKNLEGIITCYYMAIPFFHNTLLSTIIYTVIITNLFVVFTTIWAKSKIIKSNL